MKDIPKLFSILFTLLITLFACSENIDVSESRMLPEHDKDLRISSEINRSLSLIAEEVTDSDQIESCENGKNLLNSGKEILPYLQQHFADSSATKVYSKRNKRTLLIGEIAIILASEIKPIPIARVVGIQQCTPPFQMDIESYLWNIKDEPEEFTTNYAEWLKDVL